MIWKNKEPIKKVTIEEFLFEYSRTAIEKALSILLKAKKIAFVSKGQSAMYISLSKNYYQFESKITKRTLI